MKKQFLGYYRPSKEEFKSLWDSAIFVLDTNMLLNIYRYTPTARQSFLEILNGLSERLWIPHQVGQEFHKNRIEVIYQLSNVYKNIIDRFTWIENVVKEDDGRQPYISEIKQILKDILEAIPNVRKDLNHLQEEHLAYLTDDSILDQITDLFANKVGDPFPKDIKDQKTEEAKNRVSSKIPPGYMDKDKVGDVLVWFQILDYAINNKKNVILVTDDRKEDWWEIVHGRTIGPRHELIEEFTETTGQLFYMYKPGQFQAHALQYLGIEIAAEVQEEIQEEIRSLPPSISDTDVKVHTSIEDIQETLKFLNMQYKLPEADLFLDNSWAHLAAIDVAPIISNLLSKYSHLMHGEIIEFSSSWVCRLKSIGGQGIVDIPNYYWRMTPTTQVINQILEFINSTRRYFGFASVRGVIGDVLYLRLDNPNATPEAKLYEQLEAIYLAEGLRKIPLYI